MLVQLRRVVYLLVLLQCCVCLATAEKPHDSERDEKFIMERSRLKESIFRAEVRLAQQAVCMKAWEGERSEYNKVAEKSKKDHEKIDGLVKSIEKAVDSGRKVTDDHSINDKFPKLKGNAAEVGVDAAKVDETVKVAIASFASADYVRDTCRSLSNSLEIEEGILRKVVDAFREFLPKVNETDEMRRLAEKGDKVIWALVKEKTEIKEKGELYNEETRTAARAEVMGLEKAAINAKAVSSAVSSMIEKSSGFFGTAEEKIDERYKKELNDTKEEMNDITEASFDARVKKEVGKAFAERKASLTKAMEEEAVRVAEEIKKGEEEEQAIREAEEKRKAEEEERAKRAKETAAAAREKEAKEKEEKAQEELEKAKEEKKKDNSNSPALVHSPLLLPLLCVLGTILVC